MAKVKETKIDAFKPQGRNANRHSQRGMGTLEASMRKHGYVAPMTTMDSMHSAGDLFIRFSSNL